MASAAAAVIVTVPGWVAAWDNQAIRKAGGTDASHPSLRRPAGTEAVGGASPEE
ncbi:hypothetical protein [Streptomyces sp. NPDC054834]